MCVYVYVCMSVCVCGCMYVCMYVCMYDLLVGTGHRDEEKPPEKLTQRYSSGLALVFLVSRLPPLPSGASVRCVTT